MESSFSDHENASILPILEDALELAAFRVSINHEPPHGVRLTMVSPSVRKITGVENPHQVETWFQQIHPDDLAKVLAAYQRSMEEGIRYDQIARFYNTQKKQWSWLRIIAAPVYEDNGRLTHFTGLILDITRQQNVDAELKYHHAFNNLILSLSTRFIHISTEEIDRAINDALMVLGEFTGVDRAYIFAYSDAGQTMSCTNEWCRTGVSPQIHRLQGIQVDSLSWSNQKLLQGDLLHIPSVANLPEEAQNEKVEFQSQGILSLLAVPMVFQGAVIGILGFDSVRTEKSWDADSVNLLHVAGSIFVNAQENKRTQESLRKAHADLELRVKERTDELKQANEILQTEIEQRKRAEELLKISQALYSEVFDHSPLQMFIQEVLPDGRFRVIKTNPAHQRETGMTPEEIWGKTIEELVIPEVAQAINQHYRDCIQAGHPIEYEEQGPSPYWNLERIRTFRTTLAPVFDEQGKVVRLVGASEDITEKKQAAKIILDRSREEAVLAERGRLARDLHDAVTQTLFSTTLTAEVLPKIWGKDPAEGLKKLAELRELTRGALAEMRTLLLELRPDALADANLEDLLIHLTNAFIARARIPTQFKIDGKSSLPLLEKITFYRIAQEALNNIAKHADADQVTVALTSRPEEIELNITDNGQGFEPSQDIRMDHYGLRIMRERADEVGAKLEITSQTNQGTCIHLSWSAGQTAQDAQ